MDREELTLPLRLHIERENYFKWWKAAKDDGVRFVRDRRTNKVYEIVTHEWDGVRGLVTCKLLLDERRYPEHRYKIEYQYLDLLNAMEVIAHAASDLKPPS